MSPVASTQFQTTARTRGRIVGLLLSALLVFGFVQPNGVAAAATSYRISFAANGGSGSMSSQVISSAGGNLKRNTFARAGYSFTGWAKTSQGVVVYKDSGRIRPTANLKLYAKWTLVIATPPPAPVITGHTIGTLLWSDEFKGAAGSRIDSKTWTARFCGHENENGGGTCYNGEPQWYTPDAIRLDGTPDGNAVITTKRTDIAPAGATCMVGQCLFTSGRFDTQGKVSFKYGYIETRIKMPAGGANWPAYWMLSDKITTEGWPVSGEVDIAEQGGHQPWRDSAAVHYATSYNPGECCGNHVYQVGERITNVDYSSSFHTYGLGWWPDRMEFYVDGVLFWTLLKSDIGQAHWAFNDYFFIILNNATGGFGGDWSGWSQSQMTIDYVRAWKIDGVGTVVKH